MLRSIVILNDFSVARGGATALAVLSARAFALKGFSVTFITGDFGENSELVKLGVNIKALGDMPVTKKPAFSGFVTGIYNIKARNLVVEWIAENDTESTVYHLHGWSKILSPSVFSALNGVRSRAVIHAHDFFWVARMVRSWTM